MAKKNQYIIPSIRIAGALSSHPIAASMKVKSNDKNAKVDELVVDPSNGVQVTKYYDVW